MKYIEFTDRTDGKPLLIAVANIVSVVPVGKRANKKITGTVITCTHGTEEVAQSYDEVKALLFNDGIPNVIPTATPPHE